MTPVADSPLDNEYDIAQQTDAALLRRVQAQDETALAALYDRYGRLVYSIARRVVGDDVAAEEVMQDVFMRCWRGAEQYQAERGRVAVWLMTMTRYRAIDFLRSRHHQARQREATHIAAEAQQGVLTHAPPGDDAFLRDAVQTALSDLSDSQRQAIELAYYGGMSQTEIATHLDTPLGTIKSRIRDGLGKLRHALQTWVATETGSDRHDG
jgi:RNA polymerase sigma-70 factor (ECF subfamily)